MEKTRQSVGNFLKKRPKMSEQVIRPLVERCKCGKRVTDHHFKCNECWGKIEKVKHQTKMRKLMEPVIKRLRNR